MNRKIVVGITGASGSIYANLLLSKLCEIRKSTPDAISELAYVFSTNARQVWEHELKNIDYRNFSQASFYQPNDFNAPFASGSARFDTMIICPCSMGTLGRIANGVSNDLITRSADVMLKERRKLILVTRDTPLNLIHIRNMETVTLAGAVVCPASPSFYSGAKTLEELVDTVVFRILDLVDLSMKSFRWGGGA
ncbi:MAG: 3-octaprenyl-4-hydroxybenzoate carboxy-lyase [Bacteroidetes bacterium RIFCSPLOWO2_02_FULL_36_8]|nr:MAG: 3-octaprenyl-4-hydroxybenzoate carboxy-lyase [Bacteroidetes bacterium RIFCSPLOWO2_02_FULL_36_8]OFY71978.1 MAG: 3-octaprenyl-4-hydroxybenzoate carboxy-lyase [Bacteroidetes bacterium RIFCSPLOWO2_12_FULL_37_12]